MEQIFSVCYIPNIRFFFYLTQATFKMKKRPMIKLVIILLSVPLLLITIFMLYFSYKSPQVTNMAMDLVKIKFLDAYMVFYEDLFLEKKVYVQPTKMGIFIISPSIKPQTWQEELTKYYDWENDNFAESTAWPPPNEKILVIESENKDAAILTTNNSRGWAMLKSLDSNGDGILDKNDSDFLRLKIWASTDTFDPNGVSADNLSPLSRDYVSLNIDEARLTPASQNDASQLVRLIYLRTQKENSRYISKDLKLDVRTLFLPTLRGYGLLPDLHLAMSKDRILIDSVTRFSQCDLFNLMKMPPENEELVSILYRWAQVDGIDKKSRGPFIDARKLAFIEKIMAREDFSRDGEWYNPRVKDARLLEGIWSNAYLQQSTRLILQACGKVINAKYNILTDSISASGGVNRQIILDLLSESKKLDESEQLIFKKNLRNMLSVLKESAAPEDAAFFDSI